MEALSVERHEYETNPKLAEVLKQLAIPLEKVDLTVKGRKTVIERFQAIRRKDDGVVLSVVSPAYRLIQHDQALEGPLQELQQGGWEVKRATVERHGAHAHVELFNREKSLIDGEQLYPRLVVSNSVDLRGSLKVRFGIYRLACTNGLMVPDPRFGTALSLRQVHLGDVETKVTILGQELKRRLQDLFTCGQQFQGLMNQKVSSERAEKVLRQVAGKRQLERVMYLWEHAPGQPKPYQTAWGLYNGLTYWLTHEAKGGVYQRDLKSQQALVQLLKVKS